MYVPGDADRALTAPPAEATPAFEPRGDLFPQNPSPWSRRAFPYWPVNFTPLELGIEASEGDVAEDEIDAAQQRAVAARFKQRQYFFSAPSAFKEIGEESPLWWHSAQTYVESLRVAGFHAGDLERARRPYLDKARADVERFQKQKLFGVFGNRGLKTALDTLKKREAQEADYRRQLSGIDDFIAVADAFSAGRNRRA